MRELDNVIQRACLACDGNQIGVQHLPPEIRGLSGAPSVPPPSVAPRPRTTMGAEPPSPQPTAERTLREIESTAVHAALEACRGNITAAARMLGVSRTKLYRDMKRAR